MHEYLYATRKGIRYSLGFNGVWIIQRDRRTVYRTNDGTKCFDVFIRYARIAPGMRATI